MEETVRSKPLSEREGGNKLINPVMLEKNVRTREDMAQFKQTRLTVSNHVLLNSKECTSW